MLNGPSTKQKQYPNLLATSHTEANAKKETCATDQKGHRKSRAEVHIMITRVRDNWRRMRL